MGVWGKIAQSDGAHQKFGCGYFFDTQFNRRECCHPELVEPVMCGMNTWKLNPSLADVLRPAYDPCPSFSTTCNEMRWNPAEGHVPRGFRGASGRLEQIELVLVYAEPGDPLPGESHAGLESAYAYSASTFANGATQFHRNVRYIINACWPGLPLSEQMKRVWMTESVLCSAPREGGHVRADICDECGMRYLLPQLRLLPHALEHFKYSCSRKKLE